ncbi:DUF4274 domain-containing protein [Paenibacillus sp. ACRSA]|uniref:DUF4274 domain-containing protein n=1 Tax=Paenibacillus sp. ACRSA TaxID=2918211 RepID=UPI001EF45ED1|nr:DUF4274 domain-containing protein [Paenibacillus sp. ACRSA]MCG7376149.1 DUF4274 domain-containing protein [Paenibacillus sp. ACRSA]
MNWVEISKIKDVNQIREAVQGLNINERDERGRTPLMLCLTARMPAAGIRCILEQNPDLEIEDKLGDTALKKAIRFKQMEAISLLLEFGAKLDSPQGILGTAWNAARSNPNIADLLLDTPGAIRLKLTEDEQSKVDAIIYEESIEKAIAKIRGLDSAVLVHAVVSEYNWDDGPEPMLAVCGHPACAEITLLDMLELMEADYWLEMDDEEVRQRVDGPAYRRLAEQLYDRQSTRS